MAKKEGRRTPPPIKLETPHAASENAFPRPLVQKYESTLLSDSASCLKGRIKWTSL